MALDIINSIMDVVVPPATLLFLLFNYPIILFFQFWSFVLRWIFPERVRGKVVLVTGASSGIGEHIAYEYAKRGASLVLVAKRENVLRDVADRCRNLGAPHVHCISADVSKEEDCRRFVDDTINQFGRLDHLVTNAGITHSSFFDEVRDLNTFQQVVDVTFWGYVYSTYYALPHLKRTKGKILVNASVAAWFPHPREAIYNAAKAGIIQLFETLRVEVGNQVSITILQPGATESEMTRGKAVGPDGRLQMLSDDVRDTHFGPMPVTYAETVAKAAVQGTLRSYRYVIVPFWYAVFLVYRIFVPELLDYWCRVIYVTKVDKRRYTSKGLVDTLGVKQTLFPESIRKTE